MTIQLQTALVPTHLKLGIYGDTGTGKTFTAAMIMSQFAKEFCPGKHVAMFDTEPGGGFVADMVKRITGKEFLTIVSRSFGDLLEFAALCKAEGHVAIVDSITHPWRSLVEDYLDVKRSRIKGAGGNPDTVRLALKDWGPIKDMWKKFTEAYCFDPVHWCMCGREGDVWEDVEQEDGDKAELTKTGYKMKTETETGYEPGLLLRMKLVTARSPQYPETGHFLIVVKDRWDSMKAGQQSKANPDIEFCRPYINRLALGGKSPALSKSPPVFNKGSGPNWETVQARRAGVLDNIKDDIVLAYPGMDAESKKIKIELLRATFGTSSWDEMTGDHARFTPEKLEAGRMKLQQLIAERKQ